MAYTDEQRDYHREYYYQRRQRIVDFLGGQCAECGGMVGLEFDHVDKGSKSFDLKRNLTLKTILDEVRKCQLLCNACHAHKTAAENTGFTHGTLYGWMKKKCGCAACVTEKWLWYDARNAARRKVSGGRGPYKLARKGEGLNEGTRRA